MEFIAALLLMGPLFLIYHELREINDRLQILVEQTERKE